jgi:hypothetical protein
MLLDHGLLGSGKVVILQPRRLAARLLASRVASERGVELGREVGYQIRLENRTSETTRIQFETEGILLRRMLHDPTLEGVTAVIFDEFHERHLYGDITLARALDIQEQSRPDLMIVVMSATLDAGALESYLKPCATLASSGRTFPITVEYLPKRTSTSGASHLGNCSGSILWNRKQVRRRRAHIHARAAMRSNALLKRFAGPGSREATCFFRFTVNCSLRIRMRPWLATISRRLSLQPTWPKHPSLSTEFALLSTAALHECPATIRTEGSTRCWSRKSAGPTRISAPAEPDERRQVFASVYGHARSKMNALRRNSRRSNVWIFPKSS